MAKGVVHRDDLEGTVERVRKWAGSEGPRSLEILGLEAKDLEIVLDVATGERTVVPEKEPPYFFDVVFDPVEGRGGRSGPNLEFVEVEDPDGASISVGTWIRDGGRFHRLRIYRDSDPRDDGEKFDEGAPVTELPKMEVGSFGPSAKMVEFVESLPATISVLDESLRERYGRIARLGILYDYLATVRYLLGPEVPEADDLLERDEFDRPTPGK